MEHLWHYNYFPRIFKNGENHPLNVGVFYLQIESVRMCYVSENSNFLSSHYGKHAAEFD